jgi:Flp pilus assembly pilin Flp
LEHEVTTTVTHRTLAAIRQLRADQRGAGMIEYGMMIALIALVALVGLRYFGSEVAGTLYSDSASTIQANTGP